MYSDNNSRNALIYCSVPKGTLKGNELAKFKTNVGTFKFKSN